MILIILNYLPNFYIKNLSDWIENNFNYCITVETAPIEVLKPNEDGKSFVNVFEPFGRFSKNSSVRLHEPPFDLKVDIMESKYILGDDKKSNYEIFLYKIK